MATTPQVPETPAQVTIEGIPVPQEHLEFYKALHDKMNVDFEQRLLIWKRTELSELQTKMDDQVRDATQKFYEQWKEEQKPPTQEQIQATLSQEYAVLTVKLFVDGSEREFMLRELPQKIERKFYRQFKDRLKHYGPQINAFVQANQGLPFEQQVDSFLEMFDNAFDIIAEGVLIVLDPFEKEKLTVDWVQDNISSQRQWNILQAQLEINRLRDFFSQLYQAGQKVETTMTPLSYQGLLARARS